MFYQRHSDWSTKTPLRMQIWTAKIHSAEPYPAFWKTSVPGLLHYVQFDENAIPIWTSYQIYTCLKPHQSTIPKHLQEQVCPYKTLQYQEIQETLMAPFTEMTFASSRLWSLQDLKNCNDMTSSTAVFRKGGNFFRKVKDMLVKTKNMWMTWWCKDFEELELRYKTNIEMSKRHHVSFQTSLNKSTASYTPLHESLDAQYVQ